MEESQIFGNIEVDVSQHWLGEEAVCSLIRNGLLFSYYRIADDGKFFFFKTPTQPDDRSHGLLRREYELSLGCDHPHIVHVYRFGHACADKEGILMEYVEGRTLGDFIAENPSLQTRRRIFEQLIDTVGYLHKKGIIHNDLKPDNILISRNGDNLKLIDFGLSDDDAHFLLRTPGCSLAFAAPELKDSRHSDARSDIYSIGKIARLMFPGRYIRISRKCLAEAPERRYSNADDLKKAWRRRNRLWNWALLLVALAGIGVAVGAYVADRRAILSRSESLETSLRNQEAVNLKQEELNRRQAQSYEALKASYRSLQDSIKEATAISEAHEAAVAEAEDRFTAWIDRRTRLTVDSLRSCDSLHERNRMRQRFYTAIRKYYNSFPKTADGEDISPRLVSLYKVKEEEAFEKFEKVLATFRDSQ